MSAPIEGFERPAKPCRCHGNESLYGSLAKCPACGHRSLDVGKNWAGCERRKCGAEFKRTPDGWVTA